MTRTSSGTSCAPIIPYPTGQFFGGRPRHLPPLNPQPRGLSPMGRGQVKDRPDFWCLNRVCRSVGLSPSSESRVCPQPGSPTTREVQPFNQPPSPIEMIRASQHYDKGLSVCP
jgi:hypothetical protein